MKEGIAFDKIYLRYGLTLAENAADMLLIDGEPLTDIHNICVEKMEMIIKEGELVRR